MSRESNDAFEAYAKREGYKPGTWNYLRAAKAWNAALAWAAEHDDASGVQEARHQVQSPPDADGLRQAALKGLEALREADTTIAFGMELGERRARRRAAIADLSAALKEQT